MRARFRCWRRARHGRRRPLPPKAPRRSTALLRQPRLRPPRSSPRSPPEPPAPIPNALGVGRTVEIDTTGGPGFGFEHFKQLDFLRDKEVVLTFDDGPWPVNTPVGAEDAGGGMHHRHLFPDRQARDLLSRNPQAGGRRRSHHRLAHLVACDAEQQEADRAAAQGRDRERFQRGEMGAGRRSPAPFFRFPALQHPPEMVTYLGERNIAMFSCDLDSFDFKASKPQTVDRQRDEEGRQARQGHHPDARLPEAHRAKPCPNCCAG